MLPNISLFRWQVANAVLIQIVFLSAKELFQSYVRKWLRLYASSIKGCHWITFDVLLTELNFHIIYIFKDSLFLIMVTKQTGFLIGFNVTFYFYNSKLFVYYVVSSLWLDVVGIIRLDLHWPLLLLSLIEVIRDYIWCCILCMWWCIVTYCIEPTPCSLLGLFGKITGCLKCWIISAYFRFFKKTLVVRRNYGFRLCLFKKWIKFTWSICWRCVRQCNEILIKLNFFGLFKVKVL